VTFVEVVIKNFFYERIREVGKRAYPGRENGVIRVTCVAVALYYCNSQSSGLLIIMNRVEEVPLII
jgi:hypothetical protein